MANNSTNFVHIGSSHALCLISVKNIDPYNMNRPDFVHPTWIFLVVINGICSPPIIILNALIAWTVFGDERLQSSAFNVLLAFLAVTDLLVGLLVQPMYCVSIGCLVNGCYSPCQFTIYILLKLSCCSTTIITLAIASVERYLAIQHPNFYLRVATKKRVKRATRAFWIVNLAFTLLFLSLFSVKANMIFFKVPFMVTISICSLVILYCSIKVRLTAYHHRRVIALQTVTVRHEGQPEEKQTQEKRGKEYKQYFMMVILVVSCVIFLAPYIVVTLIKAAMGEDVTIGVQYLAGPICATFLHLQSLINPILMTLSLSYIRKGIKEKIAYFTQ